MSHAVSQPLMASISGSWRSCLHREVLDLGSLANSAISTVCRWCGIMSVAKVTSASLKSPIESPVGELVVGVDEPIAGMPDVESSLWQKHVA